MKNEKRYDSYTKKYAVLDNETGEELGMFSIVGKDFWTDSDFKDEAGTRFTVWCSDHGYSVDDCSYEKFFN